MDTIHQPTSAGIRACGYRQASPEAVILYRMDCPTTLQDVTEEWIPELHHFLTDQSDILVVGMKGLPPPIKRGN